MERKSSDLLASEVTYSSHTWPKHSWGSRNQTRRTWFLDEFDRVIRWTLVTKQTEQVVHRWENKQDYQSKTAQAQLYSLLGKMMLGSLKISSISPSGASIEIEWRDDSDNDEIHVDEALISTKVVGVHQLEHMYIHVCLHCRRVNYHPNKETLQPGTHAIPRRNYTLPSKWPNYS